MLLLYLARLLPSKCLFGSLHSELANVHYKCVSLSWHNSQAACMHALLCDVYVNDCHIMFLQVFEAAPQDVRGVPAKKAAPDYFL